MQGDEQAIRRLMEEWMAATKRGDGATVLSLMADDAKFVVAGRPPFGKEAFARAAGQAPPGLEFDGESEILELSIAGEWAFMLTRLTVITRQQGMAETVRSGHARTVLTKREGRWLLYRDANLLVPVERAGDGG